MEDERAQREGQQRARGENWQRRSGEQVSLRRSILCSSIYYRLQAAPPPSSPPPSGPDFQEIKETFNQFAESKRIRLFSPILFLFSCAAVGQMSE